MKVSQSMVDAVKEIMESGWDKEKTSTGTKVYGSSYGNSKKARKDQTKKEIDDLKGPNKDYKYHTGPEASHHHVHTEEKDCVTEPEAKDIAKKEVKGHEKKMHKEDSFASRLVQSLVINEEEVDEQINEVLSKDASAGDWISDFVHSDNPKFKGKSKAMRKKMALAAYYSKQNEEKECGCEDEEGHEDEKEDKELVKKMVKKTALKNEEIEIDEGHNMSPKELAQHHAKIKQKIDAKPASHWKEVDRKAKEDYAKATQKEETELGESIDPKDDKDYDKPAYLRKAAGVKLTLKDIRAKDTKAKDAYHARAGIKTEETELDEAKVTTPDESPNRVTTDNLDGRDEGGKSNSFKSFKLKLKTDGEMKAPVEDKPEETKAKKSIKPGDAHVEIKKPSIHTEGKDPAMDAGAGAEVPFAPPYNTTKDDVVTDKSGAKHTPMSRAKDLARTAMKRIKTEMLGKAPGNN